ncbi:hypothetical protein ACJ41O_002290 [Fusarium nematophilum]
MPRRRKSGFDPEPFNVRWHSIANMATPSADIMSSPDPLNDAVNSTVIPPSSTRRVTRSSQRSDRFASLATSPRKQMFELEVGDDRAPQKLLVTVETEDPGATAGPGSARRKLFQTSSPLLPLSRRREMATTTTVPLKKAIEEEVADPNATPKKRGRPRKTNGTPLPGAGTKRKSGTPIKRTPRRPRTTKTTDTAVEPTGPKAQPTPGSKRRGRPPKNRAVEPSSELGTEMNPGTTSAASGRRRRQALAPEELLQVTNEANEAAELPPLPADESKADNEMTLIITPSEAEGILQQANQASDNAQTAEPDSDIWMATLDEEPTPRPAAQRTEQPDPASPIPNHEPDVENSQFEDYGYLAPGGSDASSVDELRSEDRLGDNDTVAAGEDFSMIFMDSLPSLQANLRSSVQEITENDIGEETSMIINNTLESLRRSLQDRDKPGMDPEAAEAPKPSPHALSQPQEEVVQSSIRPPLTFSPNRNPSPRWLRSPRRTGSSPLRHQVLKLNARETADSSPAVLGEDEAPASSERRGSPGRHNQDESNLYDDSFSEIPEDVLEAASPRRPLRLPRDEALEEDVEMEDAQLIQLEEEDQIQDEQDELEEQEEQDGPPTASNASGASRSDVGRLPTPDDTPPQIQVADDSPEKSLQESQASQASVRSAPSGSSSPMVPSPGIVPASEAEVVGENVERFADDDIVVIEDDPAESTSDEDEDLPEIEEPRQQELSLDKEVHHPEVTPVNQLTSPLQEPHSLLPEVVSEKVSRPQLSPIVRAGRALQSVTSDPPSPEAREHQLRSPFRSSASRELGPKETQSSRHISISPGRRRMSTSPGKSLAFPAATQIPDQLYDDPFGSGTRHTGQASFMEALERSGGDPSPRRARATSKESTASSTRFQPRSEDEMSWVANEGPISASLRGDVPLEAFARPSAPSPSVSHAQLDGVASEADDESEQGADEMDIWEFEAQRATPRASHLQSPQKRTSAPPVQRRSTLPSPWTKQANTRTRRDSAVVPPTRPEPQRHAPGAEETEEYSLLAQKENAQHQGKAPESATRASRFDLSNFFSSPAAIPGMLAEKFLPAKKTSMFGARPPEPEPEPQNTETEHTLPTSSMFPQVPQKEFRPRANSRMDLFSPVRSSAQGSTREEHETLERGVLPQVEPRTDSVPLTRAHDSALRQRESEASSQNAVEEPEEAEMPSVAQKRDFTPRPRRSNESFFKASAQSSAPASGAPTPPRMQLSHADIQRWQQETSNASEDSPEPSRPLLRPLPPKNASPTKSSLRSPLKPHTPGRVVEFTSSVLSPVEQAKARAQRRLSNSSAASQSSTLVKRPPQGPPPQQTANKENSVASDASALSASSLAKPAGPPPLSRTAWTRQHWLFLDELLQLRRQGPYRIEYERRSDKYLGKTVKSQGEAMTLERWHLDCVDAFRAEVGGWDEAALAKRLFALILGEERRSRGVVERRSRVMFH